MSGQKRRKIIEYLARLSVQYHVPNILVCVQEALDEGKSGFDGLTITCRERSDESASFLFTHNQKVTAQFSIPLKVLRRSDESLLNYYVDELSKSTDKT